MSGSFRTPQTTWSISFELAFWNKVVTRKNEIALNNSNKEKLSISICFPCIGNTHVMEYTFNQKIFVYSTTTKNKHESKKGGKWITKGSNFTELLTILCCFIFALPNVVAIKEIYILNHLYHWIILLLIWANSIINSIVLYYSKYRVV